jgi:hypothetical protein
MKQIVLIPLMLLLTGVQTPGAGPATDEIRAKELQKERAKLQKETDPIDRAKIGVKISDILVEDVGDAVRQGNLTEMEMQLTAYAETIETAHRALVDSGRDAVKKPGGFKELEIALRQHIRRFDELSRMLNLQNRVPVEKTKGLATGIRDKLLKALFP